MYLHLSTSRSEMLEELVIPLEQVSNCEVEQVDLLISLVLHFLDDLLLHLDHLFIQIMDVFRYVSILLHLHSHFSEVGLSILSHRGDIIYLFYQIFLYHLQLIYSLKYYIIFQVQEAIYYIIYTLGEYYSTLQIIYIKNWHLPNKVVS